MVQPVGEPTSASIRPAETALKSLWIQRLKLRDEAEEARRKAVAVDHESPSLDVRAAPSDSLYPCKDGYGPMREGLVGGFQQGKSSTKPELSCVDQTKWNVQRSTVPDLSRPILNSHKDQAGDLPSQGLTEGKEVVTRQLTGGSTAAPLKSGFGPWIKAKVGLRIEEKTQLELERTGPALQRVFRGSGTGNFPTPIGATHGFNQVGEREQGVAGGACFTNSVRRSGSGGAAAEPIAHTSLGKPPLPPQRPGTSRSRPKCASRPITLKTQGLSCLPARLSHSTSVQGIPISERVIPDSQFIEPPLQMSTSREEVTTRKVAGVDEARLSRVTEETGGRGIVSCEDANPSRTGCADLNSFPPVPESGPHPAMLSSSHKGNSGVISAHMVSFGKVVPAASPSLLNQSTCRKFTVMHPPVNFRESEGEPSEGPAAIIADGVGSPQNYNDATGVDTAELPSTSADTNFHVELPVPSIRESKTVKSSEVLLRTALGEDNSNALQPVPLLRGSSVDFLETSHSAPRLDKADEGAPEPACSASSTASYPWGLFIGAAGTSRKAREQFVEVYNKARDDLKNQRTCNIVSRVPDKEMDDSARFASGQRANAFDVPNYRLEKQSLETQKQPAGNLQCQEKFETLNRELEPEHVCQDCKTLNLGLPEQEQPQSARQIGSIAQGNFWRAHDKGSQTFQTIHGVDGRAGPRQETGQYVNSPGGPSMGLNLNTYNGKQGEVVILPKHTVCLKEHEVHFKVNSEAPHGRWSHQNKDFQRKLEQRSDAVVHVPCKVHRLEGTMHNKDDCFPSKPDLIYSQNFAAALEESPLSKGLIEAAGVSTARGNKRQGASSLLGKRLRGVFPEVASSAMHIGGAGKVAIDGTERSLSRNESSPNRPHIWLQRWQSTPHISKSVQEHTHGQLNEAGQHSHGNFALGSFKFKDTNSNLVGQTMEIRQSFADGVKKEQEVKFLEMGTAKVLPSPAAMAIVGTATRQFCSAQLQRKGCLSFW